MSDLIKRSDAIEAIEEVNWYHQNKNKDMVSGANSDEHQAWYKADDVYKALEAIPSADRPHGKERVMKLIIAYAICGILTAMIAMLEKYRKGEFDPYTAEEDDEETIGTIVLLWWLYLWHRITEREGE